MLWESNKRMAKVNGKLKIQKEYILKLRNYYKRDLTMSKEKTH